jgi:hypothetical protein
MPRSTSEDRKSVLRQRGRFKLTSPRTASVGGAADHAPEQSDFAIRLLKKQKWEVIQSIILLF